MLKRTSAEQGQLESLVAAILVAAVVWLLMRHARARRQSRVPTMPRMGAPATVTREQIARLQSLHFEPSTSWSREEADLILDAVAYLREVILAVSGQADPPIELQNRLLVLILSDGELRAHVRGWRSPLARDRCFERVAAAI